VIHPPNRPSRILCLAAALATVSAALLAAPASAANPTPARPAAASTVPASRQKTVQMRGFSMRLTNTSPEAIKKYEQAIDEIADLGCTWINLSVDAFQDNAKSESIAQWWNALPKETDILAIMAKAKSRGMGIMLMPVVLLNNSGPKDWRGVINPPSWDNWFMTYNAFITDMAKLAKKGDVDIFCVGSELLSTEPDNKHWDDTIAQIRAVYPGKLTYSANWDHYEHVTFWDKLDYVGMNNYNELKGDNLKDLVTAWQKIKKDVLGFAAKQGKPFMFTEVGWHNLDNTLAEPWNYVATGKIDHAQQKLAFESFVEAWTDVPREQFMGAFVWEWEPTLKIVNGVFPHGSYTVQGTPSLDVLKKWFVMP